MTKTELPGTPPPRPLAPAVRGSETLPVSVRPQRSPAGTPAPSSRHPPPRTAARLCRHLPWPRGEGGRTGAASSSVRCNLDLGCGPGFRELEGDLAPALPPGAGRSRWDADTEQRALGRMGQGGGITEFTEHYKLHCRCQPQALLGRVKPPQATAREGSPGPAPPAPPCLLWAGSVPPVHCRESTVSPSRAFLPSTPGQRQSCRVSYPAIGHPGPARHSRALNLGCCTPSTGNQP